MWYLEFVLKDDAVKVHAFTASKFENSSSGPLWLEKVSFHPIVAAGSPVPHTLFMLKQKQWLEFSVVNRMFADLERWVVDTANAWKRVPENIHFYWLQFQTLTVRSHKLSRSNSQNWHGMADRLWIMPVVSCHPVSIYMQYINHVNVKLMTPESSHKAGRNINNAMGGYHFLQKAKKQTALWWKWKRWEKLFANIQNVSVMACLNPIISWVANRWGNYGNRDSGELQNTAEPQPWTERRFVSLEESYDPNLDSISKAVETLLANKGPFPSKLWFSVVMYDAVDY